MSKLEELINDVKTSYTTAQKEFRTKEELYQQERMRNKTFKSLTIMSGIAGLILWGIIVGSLIPGIGNIIGMILGYRWGARDLETGRAFSHILLFVGAIIFFIVLILGNSLIKFQLGDLLTVIIILDLGIVVFASYYLNQYKKYYKKQGVEKYEYKEEIETWEKIMWFFMGFIGAFGWLALIYLVIVGNAKERLKYWGYGFLTLIILVLIFLRSIIKKLSF